jgi:hypothetical protein
MSILVAVPDWHSKDQTQLKATSIAFCGSSEIVAPRLSCSVLDFPLKNQALNLCSFCLLFFCLLKTAYAFLCMAFRGVPPLS